MTLPVGCTQCVQCTPTFLLLLQFKQLARELVRKHLQIAECTQRPALLELQTLVSRLQASTEAHNRDKVSDCELRV